jgi:hypothetical protein
MTVRIILAAILVASAAAESAAQLLKSGDSGPRPLLPRDEEIALARSAAPAVVSDSATVYVLTATGYELALHGSNGTACYVARDWKISLEPHCFDREGAATVMRMHMHRGELLHRGKSMDEANRALEAGLLAGTFRLPTRPVMSWMMSSGQRLVSSTGRAVGNWRPHLMIYYPYLTAEDLGLSHAPPTFLSMQVSDPGTPLANVVVVVPDFIEPKHVHQSGKP